MLTFFNLLIIGFGFLIIYFLLKKEIEKIKEPEGQKFLDLQNIQNIIIDNIRKNFLDFQNEISKNFTSLREEAIQSHQKIESSSSKVEELARIVENRLQEIGSIKEIFAGPKSRGILGEKLLEDILKELPNKAYELQYPIGSKIVDAILKINNKIIPIDSKFPYNNYIKLLNTDSEQEKDQIRKDLIKHIKNYIEDIKIKYIEPIKETTEFAIMYIPVEGLYYEILHKKYGDIWKHAKENQVAITSPKTFEILIANLSLLLKEQEFVKNFKEIWSNILQLEKNLSVIEEKFEITYKQLNNSFNNLHELSRLLNRFITSYRNLLKLEEKIREKSLI